MINEELRKRLADISDRAMAAAQAIVTEANLGDAVSLFTELCERADDSDEIEKDFAYDLKDRLEQALIGSG